MNPACVSSGYGSVSHVYARAAVCAVDENTASIGSELGSSAKHSLRDFRLWPTPAGSVSEEIPASIPPTAVFAFFRGGPWRALRFPGVALASFHFKPLHHAIIRLSDLFKTHIRILPGRFSRTALRYLQQGSKEGFPDDGKVTAKRGKVTARGGNV